MGIQCDVCMNGWFNLSTTGCEGRLQIEVYIGHIALKVIVTA